MEKSPHVQILEVALTVKLSQLARKYGDEVVIKAWQEIRNTHGEDAYLGVCGWKTEITLLEALGCLDDYCDFLEAMILKHLEKGGEEGNLAPGLFN